MKVKLISTGSVWILRDKDAVCVAKGTLDYWNPGEIYIYDSWDKETFLSKGYRVDFEQYLKEVETI